MIQDAGYKIFAKVLLSNDFLLDGNDIIYHVFGIRYLVSCILLAERVGFEPTGQGLAVHTLSRRAP